MQSIIEDMVQNLSDDNLYQALKKKDCMLARWSKQQGYYTRKDY